MTLFKLPIVLHVPNTIESVADHPDEIENWTAKDLKQIKQNFICHFQKASR